MNVFAVNSSPRANGESKTELMLNHLTAGMREAGATVEVVNLREQRIKRCQGCFACWTQSPGRCIQRDDMTESLFPRWLAADVAVYATPLYYHTMNSAMSTFRERTLPAVLPFLEQDENGRMYHPLRGRVPAGVWLSVCGFPDEAEFDALSDYVNRTRHQDTVVMAEIYRPAAETMMNPIFQAQADDVLAATRQAGRELVSSAAVAPETMARIRQPLVDAGAFAAMGNLFWKTCIAEGVTPKAFHQKKMIPRPDTLAAFMRIFTFGLNRDAAGERTVTLQFVFSGEVNDGCYFSIRKEGVESQRGDADQPDITIETPFGVWMDILTGKADGQKLFMAQQYTVTGDVGLMLQLLKRGDD